MGIIGGGLGSTRLGGCPTIQLEIVLFHEINRGFLSYKTFLKDVIEAFNIYLKSFEEFLKGKETFLAKFCLPFGLSYQIWLV